LKLETEICRFFNKESPRTQTGRVGTGHSHSQRDKVPKDSVTITRAELQNLIVQAAETSVRLALDKDRKSRKVSSQTKLTSSFRSSSDSEKELSCSSHEKELARRRCRKKGSIAKASDSSAVPSSRVDTRVRTSRISVLTGTRDVEFRNSRLGEDFSKLDSVRNQVHSIEKLVLESLGLVKGGDFFIMPKFEELP
jgi:hypothetical protein